MRKDIRKVNRIRLPTPPNTVINPPSYSKNTKGLDERKSYDTYYNTSRGNMHCNGVISYV